MSLELFVLRIEPAGASFQNTMPAPPTPLPHRATSPYENFKEPAAANNGVGFESFQVLRQILAKYHASAMFGGAGDRPPLQVDSKLSLHPLAARRAKAG